MASSRFLQGVWRVLIALAVFLFLPTGNVLLLWNPAFLAYEYRQPRVPGSELYDPPARLRFAQETLRWVGSSDDLQVLRDLRYQGQPVYNERELRHLADARWVLERLRWVWRVAGVLGLGGLAVALWRPAWRRPFVRGVFLGSVLLLGVLAAILISALLDFDAFFYYFHKVFFVGDTGFFNWEDSLIQFYPLQFWMDATYILGAATLVEGLLLGGLSYLCLRRGKR